MSNMCKALDSQDKPNKCYMSLACCHEMLKESRCIYVDKVKLVFRTHSFLLQPTNCYISWINGCIDRIDRARKYLQKCRYVQCGAVQIVLGHTFHSSPSIHRCRRRVCSPLPTRPRTSHRCSTRIYATYLLIYTIYLKYLHAPAGPLLLVAAVFPLVLAAARLAGVLAAPLPHPLHPVALVPDQRKYFSRIFKIFFCGRTCPHSATS